MLIYLARIAVQPGLRQGKLKSQHYQVKREMVMLKQGVNKLGLTVAGTLLLLSLAMVSTPSRAHHGHSIVGPAVAFIALGALLHHGHHSHQYHYRHHYRHHYKPRRPHNHSRGGYHTPRRHYYKH